MFFSRIAPANAVVNSTSSTRFICTNYRSNTSELVADLAKTIPSNHVKISTIYVNKTSKQIQLDVNEYVGCFRLLCHVKGQPSDGIYADVIVKGKKKIPTLVENVFIHRQDIFFEFRYLSRVNTNVLYSTIRRPSTCATMSGA